VLFILFILLESVAFTLLLCCCVDDQLEVINGIADVTARSDVTSTCNQSYHSSVMTLLYMSTVIALLVIYSQ